MRREIGIEALENIWSEVMTLNSLCASNLKTNQNNSFQLPFHWFCLVDLTNY